MSVKSILQALAVFVVLILLLWLAFYVLIFALAVGVVVAVALIVKRVLADKGIISSDASFSAMSAKFSMDDIKSHMSSVRGKVKPGAEVIEGDYREVNEESAKDEADDVKNDPADLGASSEDSNSEDSEKKAG